MSEELRILRFSFRGEQFAALVENLEPQGVPCALTPAERQVACMLRSGASNRKIAQARGTSLHTVANQIASLMKKLGAGSRVELALRLSRTTK